MAWRNSHELLNDIQAAHERLVADETDAAKAHAEARLLGSAAKVLNIQLEHAKATQRLEQGSDVLPGFTIGGAAEAAAKRKPSAA